MAILKFIPPIHRCSGRGMYAHLKNAIAYAVHPDKTAGGRYTDSQNCMIDTAFQEMIRTKEHYGKIPARQSDRIGYHMVISWKPEESIIPETALEVAKEFCDKYLSEYEAVVGAHLDTEHMHAHIVFNSVNYKTGKMFRYEKGEWANTLQPLLDEICTEHGLHTLEMDTGVAVNDYPKYKSRKRKEASGNQHGNHTYQNEKGQEYNHSKYLRELIDELIPRCSSYEEFEQALQNEGYWLRYGRTEKYGEYLALKNSEMQRSRRTHTLGIDYSLPMIKLRIAAYHESIPDDETEEEDRFIIPAPVFRARRFLRTQNNYIRRQYAHMYQLGVIPKRSKHLSYKEVRQRLKELRSLEKAMELINDSNYQAASDMQPDIEKQKDNVERLQAELKQLRREKRPYEQMLQIYEKLESLEGAYLLYLEGENAFQKEAASYEKLKKQAETIPFTKEELEKYKHRQKGKENQLKRELREERDKLKLYEKLQQDFTRVMKEYEAADESMLQKMEAVGMNQKRRSSR